MTAFEHLFKSMYSSLVSQATMLLADRIMAEDVVQNVFIRLWNDGLFSSIQHPHAYLYRAVRNSCLDILKGQQRKPVVPLDSIRKMPENILSEASENSSDAQKREQQLVQLEEIIQKLPPKCRQTFELVCIKGHTYAESAKLTNTSVNMVKKQIVKAYRIIREDFKFEI